MKLLLFALILPFLSISIYAQLDSLYLLGKISGEKDEDYFGITERTGDVNADGYDDFIVGSGAGYAKLYFGGPKFDSTNYIKFIGEIRDSYGSTIAAGYDLNGDSFPDIAISAASADIWEFDEGRVYIYFGGPDIDNAADLIIDGQIYSSYLGLALTMSADLNGDGYNDLCVGSPYDYDYDNTGRFYVYYGGVDMDNKADVHIKGFHMQDRMGYALTGLKDINNDGYDELLAGMPQYKGHGNGKVFLFYGGDTLNIENSITIESDTTFERNAFFGKKIKNLSDVNSDGFEDFAIEGVNTLAVYSGKTLDTLTFLEYNPIWQNYMCVEGNIDINCDDENDLLIGLEYRIKEYIGALSVIYGPEFNASPKVIKEGTTPHSYYASDIKYIGDVNNDDIKDFIILESGELGRGFIDIFSIGRPNINVKDEILHEMKYALLNNYPNPFNNCTIIKISLPQESQVNLKIYNVLGQEVINLFDGSIKSKEVKWDGRNSAGEVVNSGIYIVKLKTASTTQFRDAYTKTIKILLLK